MIISLILSLSIPNFIKMFASIEGAREGSKILNLLKKARVEAIVQARPVEITFYRTGKAVLKLGEKIFEFRDLQLKVQLDEETKDSVSQIFYSDGTVLQPALVFSSRQGKSLRYTFDPINGKISLERSLSSWED